MNNQVDLSIGPINPSQVAEKVVANVQDTLKIRPVNIHFDKAAWPTKMRGDSDMLELMLQNLVNNAIKYTPDQGHIHLTAQADEQSLRISIKDNGIGRKSALKSRKPDNRESMGLKIVHGMLKNYFGSGTYSITYVDLHENEKPTGTLVVVQIPGTSVTRNTSPESYEKSLYSQT
jgi:K+-sensing histidine kinase KdpD